METEEDVKMMSEAEEPRHRCSFVAVDKEGICKDFQEKRIWKLLTSGKNRLHSRESQSKMEWNRKRIA